MLCTALLGVHLATFKQETDNSNYRVFALNSSIAVSVQFSASNENGPSRELAVLQTSLVQTINVVDDTVYRSASTFRSTGKVVADEHEF